MTHGALHPHGFIETYDRNDRLVNKDTLQCVHCGGHWEVNPGSGKLRGFCLRCNGPFCGPGCANCVPTEQLLENMEQGRPHDFTPTTVNVPRLWLPGD